MVQVPRKPATFAIEDPAFTIVQDPLDALDAALDPPPDHGAIAQVSAVATATAPRRSRLKTVFWSALGGLVSLALGLAAANVVEGLFARNEWLGALGLGLAAVVAVCGAIFVGREVIAIRRLGRIDALRAKAEGAILVDDRVAALTVAADLDRLYVAKPRLARARAALLGHREEIIDGADLIRLAERELMLPLDAEAQRLIGNAAKRVSLITAVAPRAVIDIAVVAFTSIALIRGIAEVYGGRPGTIGFLRLLRHVGAHLAVTGGMAAGEGIIDQVVGHGLAAKLSARLGEGVINGILTARVGLAAMAVCRPLPYAARGAPTLREVAGGLFTAAPKA
jgi:putative membrane protein